MLCCLEQAELLAGEVAWDAPGPGLILGSIILNLILTGHILESTFVVKLQLPI